MARNPFRLDRTSSRSAAVLQIVLTAVLAAALTSLVWWSSGRRAAPAPSPPPAKVARPAPAEKLDRAGVIGLASAAGSAYAAGLPPPDQSAMVGRPFALRIVFDCGRPELSITKDARQKTLKLSASLQNWTQHPAVKGLPGAPFDRVEGLWLPRPWITTDGCRAVPAPVIAAARAIDEVMVGPAGKTSAPKEKGEAGEAEAAAPPAEPEPPAPTLGLASFFAPGSDRARQRGGKPYETVQKLDATLDALGPADFAMVIEGRIGQAAPGRPVTCHAVAVDQPPVCLVAVEIERVSFVRTGSDQPLAEWR